MGKRSPCCVPDAREYPPTDVSADAEIPTKGLDTSRLVTTLEKWEA